MLGKTFRTTMQDAGLGVPRRLPLGELLLLVTLFSVVFRVLTLFDIPGITIFYAGFFTSGIAIGQAMLFDGKRPRDASIIAGAILSPTLWLLNSLFGVLGFNIGHFDSIAGFVSGIVLTAAIGPFLGYLAGLFVAAWFFLFDFYRHELTGVPRRSHESMAETADSIEPNWIQKAFAFLWPYRPAQPTRGAKGAFCLAILLMLTFAPALNFGYWNVLLVLGAGLLAAFMTGAFQLRWYSLLLLLLIHFIMLNRAMGALPENCLLYTSPSPRDATLSRMPSSA